MNVVMGDFEDVELRAERCNHGTWTAEKDVDGCEIEIRESDSGSEESTFFIVPDDDSEIGLFFGETVEIGGNSIFAFIANGVEECRLVFGGEMVGEGEEGGDANTAGNPALILSAAREGEASVRSFDECFVADDDVRKCRGEVAENLVNESNGSVGVGAGDGKGVLFGFHAVAHVGDVGKLTGFDGN